jgi:hypothetical protein
MKTSPKKKYTPEQYPLFLRKQSDITSRARLKTNAGYSLKVSKSLNLPRKSTLLDLQ